MDRKKLFEVNSQIHNFVMQYRELFSVKKTDHPTKYIETLEDYYKRKPWVFKPHLSYSEEFLDRYKDNILYSYQPSDKQVIMTSVFQLSEKFHMTVNISFDSRERGMSSFIILPTLVSWNGMGEILKWVEDNSDIHNLKLYEDDVKPTGFGLSSI